MVGAGPGAVDLLTLRAAERLKAADVVLYDALVNTDVLALAADARHVYVGKRCGGGWDQSSITSLLIEEAQRGQRVVRLKGGDPFVFGRGGEEAIAVAEAGIEVEVVPGVTSAVAVPSSVGIPLTHRGVSTQFTVVTGHSAKDAAVLKERWHRLAEAGGTLVFLMPTRNLRTIVSTLLEAGRAPTTPAAMIRLGTWAEGSVIEGTLQDIVERCEAVGHITPATLVVGEVVALRRSILGVANSSSEHVETAGLAIASENAHV